MNGATMHKDGSGPLQTDLRRFDLRRLIALGRASVGLVLLNGVHAATSI